MSRSYKHTPIHNFATGTDTCWRKWCIKAERVRYRCLLARSEEVEPVDRRTISTCWFAPSDGRCWNPDGPKWLWRK